MTLEELKNVKQGDSSKFVKRNGGYVNWTFEEVVLYAGYERALEVVKQYRGYAENCKLRSNYKMLSEEGDSLLFEVEMKNGDQTLLTTLDGWITTGEWEGLEFRDWEKENRKNIIKRSYRKVWRKDHHGI